MARSWPLWLALLATSGCAPPIQTGQPSDPRGVSVAPSLAQGDGLLDQPTDPFVRAAVQVLDSPRFSVSVPLPDRPGWREVSDRSSFLVLEHPASRSQLVLRVWYENEPANRARCEQAARLIRELPRSRAGAGLDQQIIRAPRDFDTASQVGVGSVGAGGELSGYVVAFGGSGRQCFAFAYTTTALGLGAERTIADRLAIMHDRSLRRIELHHDMDPVPRATRPAPLREP